MTESTGKVSYNGRTCVKTNTLKKRIWKKGVCGRTCTEATETQSKQINHNRKKDKNKKRKKENRQNAL